MIEHLFPALAACKHNEQPIRYHPFDTYTHTLLTLHALQSLQPSYQAIIAMLYHDVGKPEQYAFIAAQKEKNEEVIDMTGYVHHSTSGVQLASKDLKKIGFSTKECEEITRYIKRHHRPGEILQSNPVNQTKKIRKLLSEGGLDRSLQLIDIAIADRYGQYNPLQAPAVQDLHIMKEQLEALHAAEGRFTQKDLAINGTDLMTHFNLEP